ncbi:MAG: hypothetical protein DDT36_01532 [Firmicutes bacterium]|nr:hypothetical protein [Bacillota bacterium]
MADHGIREAVFGGNMRDVNTGNVVGGEHLRLDVAELRQISLHWARSLPPYLETAQCPSLHC